MHDQLFLQGYSRTCRAARVRSAAVVASLTIGSNYREDLEQEALLALWQKRKAYDARRGSWHTFSERVIANTMTSSVRRLRSNRSGQFREVHVENAACISAPNGHFDLRTDISRVLVGVSQLDRIVAVSLTDHCASETGQRLGVSRAAVYRSIVRLRAAFSSAGLGHAYRGCSRRCGAEQLQETET